MSTEKDRIEQDLASRLCPSCGIGGIKLDGVIYYSCPALYQWACDNCGHSGVEKGDAIKVISGEEAVRRRPQLYLDAENPEWRKLAEKLMQEQD